MKICLALKLNDVAYCIGQTSSLYNHGWRYFHVVWSFVSSKMAYMLPHVHNWKKTQNRLVICGLLLAMKIVNTSYSLLPYLFLDSWICYQIACPLFPKNSMPQESCIQFAVYCNFVSSVVSHLRESDIFPVKVTPFRYLWAKVVLFLFFVSEM